MKLKYRSLFVRKHLPNNELEVEVYSYYKTLFSTCSNKVEVDDFIGKGTIWYRQPEHRRPGTEWESYLADMYDKHVRECEECQK